MVPVPAMVLLLSPVASLKVIEGVDTVESRFTVHAPVPSVPAEKTALSPSTQRAGAATPVASVVQLTAPQLPPLLPLPAPV